MAKLKNLEDLFEHSLKDLYSAEKQALEAMPKMAQKANDPQLKQAFQTHLKETEEQKKRLEQIFEMMQLPNSRMKCEAMDGLIKESEELIHENATPEVKDAGLIAAAQKMEHYEISGYGTAAHYAQRLGKNDVFKLLDQTLKEEQKTDTLLNDLAKNSINQKAMAGSSKNT